MWIPLAPHAIRRHASAGLAALALLSLAISVPWFGAERSSAPAPGVAALLPAPADDSDFYDDGRPPAAKVELGRLLFFDKILSGNRNVSCASCHHPQLASADGVALSLGEGAAGLGSDRVPGDRRDTAVLGRVPRNSPALFNLGARAFTRIYHDGRVELDPDHVFRSGFFSPAKWHLPPGLDNVLAAQAMFPVLSEIEMAGQVNENDVARALYDELLDDPADAWDLLAGRLAAIPQYVDLFRRAFPDRGDEIRFVDAANAIAAFEATAMRADDSPFDRFLRGDERALSGTQLAGLELFYGKAACASCHRGLFQTDHLFHAIAMPQVGPGKGHGTEASYWQSTGLWAYLEDHGRGEITGNEADDYAFRTPSLRNVTLTGPWGHAGAYASLEAVVRHHLDPVGSLERFRLPPALLIALPSILELSFEGHAVETRWMEPARRAGFLERDGFVQANRALRRRIAAANELAPSRLTDVEVAQLLAFLDGLTDAGAAARLQATVPRSVPSGLPVDGASPAPVPSRPATARGAR